MENPFAKLTQKDTIYVIGAVASIGALAWIVFNSSRTTTGPATITDVPNTVPTSGINYVSYNTGDVSAPIQQGADTAPNTDNSSCCCANNDCAGPSPLATGDTFSGLNQLLMYYQNTNPVYVQLQKAQLQQYAAYFSAGEAYSRGGTPLGVAPIGSVTS